jgi:hypothetical protein
VLWFGRIEKAGKLSCSVTLNLPAEAESRLRIGLAGQSCDATARGEKAGPVTVSFGELDVREGYQRFELASMNAPRVSAGAIVALTLDGPAADGAHFNLKPRRNAASVHLKYPNPDGAKVSAFYCEVTGLEDPVATYYMACGWHRGYFGMQVNDENRAPDHLQRLGQRKGSCEPGQSGRRRIA